MARLNFIAHTGGEVALSAATKKTVLQILAPANQRVVVKGYRISFDGTSGSAEPVLVEFSRQSTAGTMSAGTSAVRDTAMPTVQTTVTKTASAEPTETSVVFSQDVHPQTGVKEPLVFDEEIIVPGGGRLGVACTAPATVNVVVALDCEE
jgi:hypothetical protein